MPQLLTENAQRGSSQRLSQTYEACFLTSAEEEQVYHIGILELPNSNPVTDQFIAISLSPDSSTGV